MNETLINLLQQNKAENVRRKSGRGKKIPSSTVVNKKIPQEEQLPDPLWQCNNLAESSNDESSDEEVLAKFARSAKDNHGTIIRAGITCK